MRAITRREDRRHREVEPSVASLARVESAAADSQIAEHGVDLARSTLDRVKIERELLREELELEADRIRGHAELAGQRADADTRLAALEAARLNPDLAAGDTVRARRKELGLTQTGLANRACVTVRKVSDVESGRGGADGDLRCIARVLDLDYQPAQFSRPDRDARAVPSIIGAPALPAGDDE